MDRKEFIKACGITCLAAIGAPSLLQGCAGTKYLDAAIEGSDLVIPLAAFEIMKDGNSQFRKYIVAENTTLQFPVCIYRISESEYHALWMKCTHQGTELHVFGDRLQCPAHGSEFTTSGAVQNGPAADPLRSFTTVISDGKLKINLK